MNHHPKNESSLQIHVSINESANYLYVIINNFYVMITDKQFSCVCKIYKCPSLRFYDSRSIVLQYPYWNRQLVHMTICQWIVFCKRNVTKIWKLYSLLLKHGNFYSLPAWKGEQVPWPELFMIFYFQDCIIFISFNISCIHSLMIF